jgi:spore maturation protein CgeB
MRLFEATGVGSCLLTDAAENLPELFQPDREVATFRTVEECVEQVARLLERDDERTAVARAGQARCLAEHTYERRGVRLAELVRSALP